LPYEAWRAKWGDQLSVINISEKANTRNAPKQERLKVQQKTGVFNVF
jgi:hypothetical protein